MENKKMKYIFITLSLYCSLIGYSQNRDSMTTDIFLDKEILKELSIDVKFINSIEYTPDGYILLSSPNRFYILGVGGIVPVWGTWNSENVIEAFTITADSILVALSGNALYLLDSDNSFTKFQIIPDNNMGISSKYDNIYVYDRILKNDKKNYSIYQMSEYEEITPLVTIPTPILSVFETPSQLIFSTRNILVSVDIKTKKLFQLFSLQYEEDIISIVGDTQNKTLYFSTNRTVYRIKNNQIELLSENFGGILRYDGEGLLVFNPKEDLMVRFRNNVLNSSVTIEKPVIVQQEDKRLPGEPKMILVEGGTFTMGYSTEEQQIVFFSGKDEKPAHQVTVGDFYIGKYEVTQAQWVAIMGQNPSKNKGCNNCPVENVSWYDVQEFIDKLNQSTGKNYRLPTEAEWEYAARGGYKSRGYIFSGSDNRNDVAWSQGNSLGEKLFGCMSHFTGVRLPNELGIYDMSGNVSEWCSDGKRKYSSDTQIDPIGPLSNSRRVNRGGSWQDYNQYVFYRASSKANTRSHTIGFRLALSVED